MFIEHVGLSYEDPEWVQLRLMDLLDYYKGNMDQATATLDKEQPQILREYQNARTASEGIKVILEDQERNLTLIKGGHSRIGIHQGKVLKQLDRVLKSPLAITRVELVSKFTEICGFIKAAINMYQNVSGVVKVYPTLLIINSIDRYSFYIMMEIAPGIELGQVIRNGQGQGHDLDKYDLIERIVASLRAMGQHGYGFSDFALDNIMYDVDTDIYTIVDIKPSDFGRSAKFIRDSIGNAEGQLFFI
jgi:hypothetical protein